VRTTVTLDKDVERNLKEHMRKTGGSFKESVNELLRIGLLKAGETSPLTPFTVRARPLGLREGLSYDNVEDLLDQLDGAFRR
jgi:hypothetical protein